MVHYTPYIFSHMHLIIKDIDVNNLYLTPLYYLVYIYITDYVTLWAYMYIKLHYSTTLNSSTMSPLTIIILLGDGLTTKHIFPAVDI